MTVGYLGSLSVGATIPGAGAAIAAGVAGLNVNIDLLSAQLTALNAFAPVSLDFGAQLALAESMVASVTAAIGAVLAPPDLSAQIAIIAAQIAELAAQLASIQASLAVMAALSGPLAAAGVHAYSFAGQVNQLGGDLTAELASGVPGGAGGAQASNALVLVTTVPATWAAMGAVFEL